MNARERMLGRLRAAPQTAVAHDAGNGNGAGAGAGDALAALDQRIHLHYRTQRDNAATPAALVQRMQQALTNSRADVLCCAPSAWPALLAAKLAEHGVRRLLLDTSSAEGAALEQALPPGMRAMPFNRPIEEWKEALFTTVDAGFTVARSGIAATGTLVLAPDAGTPRTVSLVPPLHVALVYASTLHADLQAAAAAERWGGGMPSNLVLVSSPSKTSDIQQTLAYGAHGPRWLWTIIVMDLEAQP